MKSVTVLSLLALMAARDGPQAGAQIPPTTAVREYERIASLGLRPDRAEQLRDLLKQGDYAGAEQMLIAEIGPEGHSPRTGRLLSYLSGVYFLAHDDSGAAIALSKADAIQPLEPALRFSLAMALIRIGRREQAAHALDTLATQEPVQALYPYWLGRLDYDAQQYNSAIAHFEKAITLDPKMARAYDNLGLCFFFLNQNDAAIAQYKQAIELDAATKTPSPWPYLNLGVALEFTGQLDEAVRMLRQSIRIDPTLAKAHFELGNTLERHKALPEAVEQFQKAAALDAAYPEPHVALGRLYRKMGKSELSQQEVEIYKRLHLEQSHDSQPASKP